MISGNGSHGVEIIGGGYSFASIIAKNLIGTDVTGTLDLGNSGDGVRLETSNFAVGNSYENQGALGNIIAFNGGSGVTVIGDAFNNSILRNSILSNGKLGIDLGDDGVTPNDPHGTPDPQTGFDSDEGPNHLQNFPVITSATASGKTLSATRGFKRASLAR